MNIDFTGDALEDYRHWQDVQPAKAERIKALLLNIAETPFTGLGKPEPLRHDLRGYWSRRIDAHHRLVYKVSGDTITVVACRFHYGV